MEMGENSALANRSVRGGDGEGERRRRGEKMRAQDQQEEEEVDGEQMQGET